MYSIVNICSLCILCKAPWLQSASGRQNVHEQRNLRIQGRMQIFARSLKNAKGLQIQNLRVKVLVIPQKHIGILKHGFTNKYFRGGKTLKL